ncbi:MAG: acetyl-CoA carboxylase biotin carboxyl carrier protein subunit [Planctomycetota bacterium]|nr:acetyl-CoA carboxylase biotin carboxyl carrier protein subunit [Planctomycetota bacterium]
MRYFVTFASGEERVVRFETTATGLVAHVENGDELRSMTFDYAILEQGKALNLIVGDESHDFYLGPRNGGYEVHYRGAVVPVDIVDERERVARSLRNHFHSSVDEVRASMSGAIVEASVAAGDVVTEGQTLLVIEAMKMQNPIAAPRDGSLASVHVAAGDTVAAGDLLVSFSAE